MADKRINVLTLAIQRQSPHTNVRLDNVLSGINVHELIGNDGRTMPIGQAFFHSMIGLAIKHVVELRVRMDLPIVDVERWKVE